MTDSSPKPKAYSYVRMSTDIQLKGDSLRRQLEQSRDFAEKNDLELVEGSGLHDIGVSAFKGANIADAEATDDGADVAVRAKRAQRRPGSHDGSTGARGATDYR